MLIVNKKINPTMVELIIGIVLYGIIGELLLTVLSFLEAPLEKIFNGGIINIHIGFLTGIAFSIFMIIHMASAIERSLDMGEHGALKHTRITYAIRIVILLVIFIAMLVTGIGNVFSMLFGLLSLKLSAYAQPITHRIKEKFKKGR